MRTDYDTCIPLVELMAQVDRLAELCDLEREIAWDHPLIVEEDLNDLNDE